MDSTYAAHILPPLVVLGLGIGLVMAPAMSLATSGVAAHDAGVASAAVNAMQQIGGSIGTALLNTLAASAATGYLAGRNPADPAVRGQALLESYSTAYWWSAGFFAAGLLISVLLYRRGVPAQDENAAPTFHMWQHRTTFRRATVRRWSAQFVRRAGSSGCSAGGPATAVRTG